MPLGVQAPCCPETRSQRHRLEASGLSRSRGAGSGRVPFQPPQHDCPPALRSPWWWPEDTRPPGDTHLPEVPKDASWKLMPCLSEQQRSVRKRWTRSRTRPRPASSAGAWEGENAGEA